MVEVTGKKDCVLIVASKDSVLNVTSEEQTFVDNLPVTSCCKTYYFCRMKMVATKERRKF